ncbi:transposase [Leisingera thetidis]|uniref:transposase n=1 Tax=Leisingera thetidis TaxID=2930199 RepID=UPI003D9CA31B
MRSEHESDAKYAGLCRKHGLPDDISFNWKVNSGGVTASESSGLKALEDENGKLKKLLLEQKLDLAAMKELVSKKC